MKYINALQTRTINDSLGKEIWDELAACGHMIGGGIVQKDDGELVFAVWFETSTFKGGAPQSVKGFRIECSERPMAKAF